MFIVMQLVAYSLICGGRWAWAGESTLFVSRGSIVPFSNIGDSAMNHGQGLGEKSLMKAVNAVIFMNDASCSQNGQP